MRPRLSSLLVCFVSLALLFTNSGSSASDKGKSDKKAEKQKEVEARVRAKELTRALGIYATDHDGDYPSSLEQLLQKDKDGGPWVTNRKALLDPWGKKYQFNPLGPKNRGRGQNEPDVWTVTPSGKTIGNWADPEEKLSGTITGKILYQGKPLTDGFISFNTPDFKTSAKINADGTYQVRKLPVGPVKVCIQSKSVAIPKKYTKVLTTDLLLMIKEGNQTHDIELK